MNKIILVACLISNLAAFGQEKKPRFKYEFINQTELQLLPGRVNYYGYNYQPYCQNCKPAPQPITGKETVFDIGIQTFNGFKIKPKTIVGLTLGFDGYNTNLIVPVALGVRQELAKKDRTGSRFITSLDAGWGFSFLNKTSITSKQTGGLMINPAVGFKFPTKNGSAWLFNVGYKYQYNKTEIIYTEETQLADVQENKFRRMQVRIGFEF